PVGEVEPLLRVNGTTLARKMHRAAGMRERRTEYRNGGGQQDNREVSAVRSDHYESPSRCSGKRSVRCACHFPKKVGRSAEVIQRDDQIVLIAGHDRMGNDAVAR